MCDYETIVMAALAMGSDSAEIQQHLKTCATCGESALVWGYLQKLACEKSCDAPLPSAGLIWWRAQLAEKRRLAARSVAAIEIMQKIAMALIAGLIAAAAVLWGSQVFDTLPLPLPAALVALLLAVGSIGGMFYAWLQGHSPRFFARQR